MTELGLWLSGISFMVAVLASVIAVAEHRRAVRAEDALQAHCRKHGEAIIDLVAGLGEVTRSNASAWQELERSLAILREAASAHEAARTLVAIAELAPQLGRRPEGQAALAEALPLLRAAGASRDAAEALALAARENYAGSF